MSFFLRSGGEGGGVGTKLEEKENIFPSIGIPPKIPFSMMNRTLEKEESPDEDRSG
jgi:hypothetical protein